MKRMVSYLALLGMVMLAPTGSASVAQAPDASADTTLPKSTQAVCTKFYSSLDEKKRNSAQKEDSATVTAIEQIKVILKERDAAVVGQSMSAAQPKLDDAEKKID